MHLFRALIIRISLAAIVVGLALWLIPRFIDLETQRNTMLERINRQIPGHLSVARIEVILLPHVGFRATDMKYWLGSDRKPENLVAEAAQGEFRLDIKTIFSAKRLVHLHLPDARLYVRKLSSGQWNFWALLPGGKTPKSEPVQTKKKPSEPSNLQKEIEARAQELASGEFEREIPASTSHTPAYVPTPPPPPEPPFILKSIRFAGITGTNDVVRIVRASGPAADIQLRHIAIDTDLLSWNIRARTISGEPTPIGAALALCEATQGLGEEFIDLSLNRRSISVTSWKLSEQGAVWDGKLRWNGKIDLQAGTKRASGRLPSVSCGIR